jgi:hypothetical protein
MDKDVIKELQDVYEQIMSLNKQNQILTKLIKDHISGHEVEIIERKYK